ncbi:hypothetical protein [Amycolatopsis sp. NPDC003731]
MPDTDWIKPGAPIAYYTAGRDDGGLTLTTVRTVAKLSFTVEGFSHRFRLRDMRTKSLGTAAWSHYHYQAVHPDSPTAVKVAAADLRGRLRSAVFPFLHNDADDLARVDAAIAALTAWRAELTKGKAA